jgi:hypothetical protein
VCTNGECLILDPIVHSATTIFHKLTEKHFSTRCETLTGGGGEVHGLVLWVIAQCSPASDSVSGKYPVSIFFAKMSTANYSVVQQLGANGVCCFVFNI